MYNFLTESDISRSDTIYNLFIIYFLLPPSYLLWRRTCRQVIYRWYNWAAGWRKMCVACGWPKRTVKSTLYRGVSTVFVPGDMTWIRGAQGMHKKRWKRIVQTRADLQLILLNAFFVSLWLANKPLLSHNVALKIISKIVNISICIINWALLATH